MGSSQQQQKISSASQSEEAAAENNENSTTTTITLERSPAVLEKYLDAIYELPGVSGFCVLEEHLWDYDLEIEEQQEDLHGHGSGGGLQIKRTKTRRKRPFPVELRFPTPRGWCTITTQRYQTTFENINISLRDLVDSDDNNTTQQQRMEMAFVYLAVTDLYVWGYLDDNCNPFLTPAAKRSTRRHCPLVIMSSSSTYTTDHLPNNKKEQQPIGGKKNRDSQSPPSSLASAGENSRE